MKKLVFAIAVLFASFNAIGSTMKDTPVTVLNTSLDVFYFKIDKMMIGGTVEVYNQAGEVVATQNLESKKLIIDFFEILPGDYKIVVKKDQIEETFNYTKIDYHEVSNNTLTVITPSTPGK